MIAVVILLVSYVDISDPLLLQFILLTLFAIGISAGTIFETINPPGIHVGAAIKEHLAVSENASLINKNVANGYETLK